MGDKKTVESQNETIGRLIGISGKYFTSLPKDVQVSIKGNISIDNLGVNLDHKVNPGKSFTIPEPPSKQ